MRALNQTKSPHHDFGLDGISADFAGRIATAVWFGKLSEEAAREALWSYAMASHGGMRRDAMTMLEALLAEYRRRREQQDICW
jgi:hypothetical protein